MDLYDDVILHVLSYLTASDLNNGIGKTSKAFRNICCSPKLWKPLCERTGKHEKYLWGIKSKRNSESSSSSASASVLSSSASSPSSLSYFDLYYKIPCVPEDYPDISTALTASPDGGTITLLPGTYNERIAISKSVRIRAADATRGAAIVYHQDEEENDNQSAIDIDDSAAFVSLHNLNIFHFSSGSDIWNGNCAIYSHGTITHTVIDKCSIQSDSGRGVVVSGGASLKLSRSTIHDCAATGLYVGHMDSIIDISKSNILRNGYGTISPAVPSGHSGLYIVSAEAEIRDSLIAENCLTGLSLIGHGTVHIYCSDIIENGQEPIVVLDDGTDSGDGGVYEHSNNFERYLEETVDDFIRCLPIYHKPFTKSMLIKNSFHR